MATFKFGRYIDIHWNGYDIQGPADTVFSIPDQLYEEFDADIAPVEPTLQWIDTNEFLTLQNSVSVSTLEATFPIAVSTTTSGRNVSLVSTSASAGNYLRADGSGGVSWSALPADATGITDIIGTSPISAAVAGTQATVSIDQTLITGAAAATNAQTVRTYVKNTTGTTIAKGSAVYVSGATGDNALIALSTASTELGSSKTLGITAESIANDAFGYVVESGYLTGINTTGISAGTSIWLGNTPGALVFGAPPAEPSHSVYLGVVIREQQNNGSILVKVQNGYEIDELHDVSAASPSDGDILQYKTSSSLWTKASIANAGIASSVHTHDYQPSGSYQTAGTYVNAVVGTSPASVSTTSGTATVSIVASSINSTHLANNAVVAATIAAASVGTVAINSGSATNSTVLTADGSGGAAFLPVTAGASFIVNQAYWSGIVTNTISAIDIGLSSTTVSQTSTPGSGSGVFAIDETSGWVFQVMNRTFIVKSELSSGAVISTTSFTAMNTSGERITDIEINTGSTRNLCIVTGTTQTTAPVSSKYYIIDPAAMTTKNTGNIIGSIGSALIASYPRVAYDPQLGEFTIRGSVFLGGGTNPRWSGLMRTLHPTTYATRINTFSTSSYATPNGDTNGSVGNLIYISAHSGWIGAEGSAMVHWIDGGGSSQFLTEKSRRNYAANSTISSFYYFASHPTDFNSIYVSDSQKIAKFSISSISSGFTTTTTAAVDPVASSDAGMTSLGRSITGSDPNIRILVIDSKTYVGNPNVSIIDENFYSSTYSEKYWEGPYRSLGPGVSGTGNMHRMISESNVLKIIAASTTTNSSGGSTVWTTKYTLGAHLNIDFVSQSSASAMLIGFGPLSQSGATTSPTFSNPALGSSFDSTGISQTYGTSGSTNSIRMLKPGYTYRYRFFPKISTSNTTVSYPDNWILKT